MKDVELIQVIRTNLTLLGNGKETYCRRITQYWSVNGELLAEVDPLSGGRDAVDLLPEDVAT